jgi:hypothetical protein
MSALRHETRRKCRLMEDLFAYAESIITGAPFRPRTLKQDAKKVALCNAAEQSGILMS